MTVAVRWPDRLVARPLTSGDARRVTAWRYDGPWAVYDPADNEPLDAADGYRAVVGAADDLLVGFYCTGAQARVPGLTAEPGVVDLGAGMDPAWVGRGYGASFGRAVLTDVRRNNRAARVRAVVQLWNTRSRRLLCALGFLESGRHTCVQGECPVEYVVLLLPA